MQSYKLEELQQPADLSLNITPRSTAFPGRVWSISTPCVTLPVLNESSSTQPSILRAKNSLLLYAHFACNYVHAEMKWSLMCNCDQSPSALYVSNSLLNSFLRIVTQWLGAYCGIPASNTHFLISHTTTMYMPKGVDQWSAVSWATAFGRRQHCM